MKNLISNWQGKTQRVTLCSTATVETEPSIEIMGRTLVPDEDTAYVDFRLSHVFPVVNKYRTAMMPQVVANSHLSLINKVFNLAHLMRKYNPKEVSRDRILGTIIAVEFVDGEGNVIADLNPEGGFALVENREIAQGIRAVAVMHKAAESVMDILESWFTGRDPIGGPWSVSIENSFHDEDCGFLVKGQAGIETFVEATPKTLLDLGWTYVPWRTAPDGLLLVMNNAEDDKREGLTSGRVVRDFKGQETVLLLGGLDNKIRYRGVGLTPGGGAREEEAHVKTMLAAAPVLDVEEMLNPLLEFGKTVFGD